MTIAIGDSSPLTPVSQLMTLASIGNQTQHGYLGIRILILL